MTKRYTYRRGCQISPFTLSPREHGHILPSTLIETTALKWPGLSGPWRWKGTMGHYILARTFQVGLWEVLNISILESDWLTLTFFWRSTQVDVGYLIQTRASFILCNNTLFFSSKWEYRIYWCWRTDTGREYVTVVWHKSRDTKGMGLK
jgi:hypothetical protein